MSALHTKYRPTNFDEVVGHKDVVKTLRRQVEKHEQRAFLFSSDLPGVGKTTLARIAARECGCAEKDIVEVAAAQFTGVDDMRDVVKSVQYEPFGNTKGRAVILDECHRLSGQAWDSLLKPIEEPPKDVFWFLCTTNVSKVPKAIRSRCQAFALDPLKDEEVQELVEHVCFEESIEVHEDVFRLIVSESEGSPRRALVNLDLCREAQTKKEAARLLKSAQASEPALELCRFLANDQRSWAGAMKIVSKFGDESAEGVRIQVSLYMTACAKKAADRKIALYYLHIIECFSVPYNQSDKYAPLLLSIGRALFPNGG